MDSTLVSWILTIITGAIGGNVAGAALKDHSLGGLGNTIAGIVGGGLGGQVLAGLLGGAAGESGLVGSIVGSGIGGAALMFVIGLLKKALVR